ncbi:hypothetical protein Dimus_019654 [Dionaea muscipula]
MKSSRPTFYKVFKDGQFSTRRKMHEDQASGRRRWRPGRCSLDKKPHFFKIIVSSAQQNQLRIPPEFVRNHGKDLSKWARLTVPDGTVWEVELVKSGEGFCLRRGWDKFMKGFSIGYGYLLLFRYEGNSHFHVIIFDLSATEVEYPLVTGINSEFQSEPKETEAEKVDDNGHGNGCLPADGDGDDESLEISDHSPIGTTPDMCDVEMTGEGTEDDDSMEILDNSSSRLGKRNDAPPPDHLPGEERCIWSATKTKKVNVKEAILQKAEAFRSESPSFIVVMWPSYVSNRFSLHIPMHHGKKYLVDKENMSITLRAVGSSKKWRVRCSISRSATMFSTGWDVFVRENHLNVGDVCVFEMIQGHHQTYTVHIFRDEHP